MVEVKRKDAKEFFIIEIALGGVITPQDLEGILEKVREVVDPRRDGRRGVIISGRLPIWAASSVAHEVHWASWVATYDPRLQAGVVVMSHVPDRKVGDVIPVSPDE